MAYYTPGSPLAACLHVGATQTDLFTVNSKGQLCVLTVEGAGAWSSPLPLTPENFALPGSFVAASPGFGASVLQTDVFVVDQAGALQLFSQTTPGSSWRKLTLSEVGAFVPGHQSFAVMPDNLSQTPIVNRIDVFIIDQGGALRCYHRDAGQQWSLDILFQLGAAAADASLTATYRVADSQIVSELHLVFVDSTGALNWITNFTGTWQLSQIPRGGSTFTPYAKLAASVRFGTGTSGSNDLDDLNVFGVDDVGRVICYAWRSQVWQWTPVSFLLEFALAGAPICASRQFIKGVYQTDVFVIGKDKSLNVFFSQDDNPWSLPIEIAANAGLPGSFLAAAQQVGSPSLDNPFQTNLFICDSDLNLSVFYVINAGAWQRLVLPNPFDPELTQLSSNTNVVFSTGRSFLNNLQVDILITEDVVPAVQIDAFGNQVGGLSIQLNCSSPPGDKAGLQQFTFEMVTPGSVLSTAVQNWTPNAQGGYIFIDQPGGFGNAGILPSAAIPAGYRLQVNLTTTPYGEAINGAEFRVFEPGGTIIHWQIQLLKCELRGPGGTHLGPVKEIDLSRVLGFQLDIVADDAGQFSQFASGAGTITYTSTTILVPVVTPNGVLPRLATGETSNLIYSTVPTESDNSFIQRFQVSP